MRRKDDKLQILSKELVTFLVAMRLGVTPVPIPNTMVKTQAADGTALETMWESRWLPEFEKEKLVLPVIRGLKGFSFLMTDETSSQNDKMRSFKIYDFIAHGITCQCIEKHLCLDKQACHT